MCLIKVGRYAEKHFEYTAAMQTHALPPPKPYEFFMNPQEVTP